MPNTKLFLVQFLIEADVTEWPDFDEQTAKDYFRAALKLSAEDKKLAVQVYLLARKPDEPGDLLIEEYDDRGLNVQIFQNADTVGTDVPSYYVLVLSPKVKGASSSAGGDHPTIDGARAEARARVDRRLARQQR